MNGEDETSGLSPGIQVSLGLGDTVFLGGARDFEEVDSDRVGFDKGFNGALR